MREHRCSRVVSIIQARMGSKRFPGKMLAKLAGKPLLFHIISRAQKIKLADEIVLATTTHESDDLLVDLGKAMNIKTIRGSENRTGAVPSFSFFQSTIVNRQSSIQCVPHYS